LFFPFHVIDGFRGFCIFLFGIWLFFSTIFFLLSGFLCLLERSHEARSFAINKRGVFTGWEWAQEKSAIGLKDTANGKNEWNGHGMHPAFFNEEGISTQETISMDEDRRNSCINKGILGGSTAWDRAGLGLS
jgi:hypothetical protein